MFQTKIVSRTWLNVGSPATVLRLFCTCEDGSVYSCDKNFANWKKEEPTTAELEQKIKIANL